MQRLIRRYGSRHRRGLTLFSDQNSLPQDKQKIKYFFIENIRIFEQKKTPGRGSPLPGAKKSEIYSSFISASA
jgi:hypothetical protein